MLITLFYNLTAYLSVSLGYTLLAAYQKLSPNLFFFTDRVLTLFRYPASRKARLPPQPLGVNSFWVFCPRLVAWGILVPPPGIEPIPPAMEAWSLNHWTTREVPISVCLETTYHEFVHISSVSNV